MAARSEFPTKSGDWVIENGIRWAADEPPRPFDKMHLATTLTPRKSFAFAAATVCHWRFETASGQA
jgi:hypothetical protein